MVCAPLLYAENTLLACCIYRVRDKNIPMLLYKTSPCFDAQHPHVLG